MRRWPIPTLLPILLASVACGAEPERDAGRADQATTITAKATFPSNVTPTDGAIIVEGGHQWIVHKVVPRAVDFDAIDALPTRRSMAPSSDTLSDAEVADRMRPIVLSASGDLWQTRGLRWTSLASQKHVPSKQLSFGCG